MSEQSAVSEAAAIIPGRLRQLRPGLACVTADNPGAMTGPGTNSYLVGEQKIAIIDPGPADDAHIAAMLAALDELGGELAAIVVTHTHPDHSPAARCLAEKTGAPCYGREIAQDGFQDDSFSADTALEDGQRIELGEHSVLALHTPGHVDNHFCFLHEQSGLLITGDHIMQGSTVVIIPPAGHMGHYIASLRKMLDYPVTALAPGHGGLIDKPREEIEYLIKHRLGREEKVVRVLRDKYEGTLETLTPLVYDDVDESLHPVAQFSLWSHLIKLRDEGRVTEQDTLWRWAGD